MAYPANMIRAVYEWYISGGASGFNVLHFQRSDLANPTVGDLETLGGYLRDHYMTANFRGQVNPSLRSLTNFNTILGSIDLSSCDTPPSVASPHGIGFAGTMGSAAMPREACVVVSLGAPGAGRRNRGRIYLPPGDISQMNAGQGRLTPSAVNNYYSCFLALVVGLVSTDFEWVIHSVADGAGKFISSITPHTTIHHQRRRNS